MSWLLWAVVALLIFLSAITSVFAALLTSATTRLDRSNDQ